MKQTYHISMTVPNGYGILEKQTDVDITEALGILSSRRQRRYLKAIRQGVSVRLVSQQVVCACGDRKYLYDGKFKKLPTPEIEAFCSEQMSFFDSEGTELIFNKPYGSEPVMYEAQKRLACSRCGRTLYPETAKRRVEITREKHVLSVYCELSDIDELFSSVWLSSVQVPLEFPLFEKVSFNFRNGHTYVSLVNGKDMRVVKVSDITNDPNLLTYSRGVTDALSNIRVRRVMKKQFESFLKGTLPFEDHELNIRTYSLMARFLGFDREFFDAVPYDERSGGVHRDFKKTANKLKNVKDAVSFYKASALPDIKSVRKVFYSRAGLLFYRKECERLWQILNDANLLCRLMKQSNIYLILSQLHVKSGIFIFLEDYCKVKGGVCLLRLLEESWELTKNYAINYIALDDAYKRRRQKSWKRRDITSWQTKTVDFSVPCCEIDSTIKDCVIDGYVFYWLRTAADYESAGRQLNNCLREWDTYKSPVVCVRRFDKTLAAIEVSDRTVTQVYAHSNTEIEAAPELERVYRKWLCKYNIVEDIDEIDFDD